MKTIIISDLHLYKRFLPVKFRYLSNLFQKADRIIINGDFWDYGLTTFDKFMKSRWQDLFPLLKEKNAVYIYGNHDKQEWCDERVNLFSVVQKDSLELELGDKKLHICHGHQFFKPVSSLKHKVTKKAVSSFGLLSSYFFKIGKKKSLASIIMKNVNKKLIKNARKVIPKENILVTGHTHCAEFNEKNNYINSGFIHHGLSTFIQIDNNDISLIKERYKKKV